MADMVEIKVRVSIDALTRSIADNKQLLGSAEINIIRGGKPKVVREDNLPAEILELPQQLMEPEIIRFITLAGIKPSYMQLWLRTYGDAHWIRQEFFKMIGWLAANPKKKPKSQWSRFISSWLARGWEYHRRSIPAEKEIQSTLEQLREYESKDYGTGEVHTTDRQTKS